MLKQICEGFDEERQSMENKYGEIAKLLQQVNAAAGRMSLGLVTNHRVRHVGLQAVQDIVFLSNRNSELEKQLHDATS